MTLKHPFAAQVSRFALRLSRKSTIRSALVAAANVTIAEDDALASDLATQGGDAALSTRELLQVCAARGIRVDGTHRDRLDRLVFWLQARRGLLSALSDDGNPPPVSLVLHMPALLSALVEQAHAHAAAQ